MSKNTSCLKSNQLKGNGGLGKTEGYTKYDAIRLVEKNNGLFIKLTDPTFSRSYLQNGSGRTNYLSFTKVHDCRLQWTTSTANLERTIIKFSPSVLPHYQCSSTCSNSYSGDAVLSSNNQVMTITARAKCGGTFFKGPSIDGQTLLKVTF